MKSIRNKIKYEVLKKLKEILIPIIDYDLWSNIRQNTWPNVFGIAEIIRNKLTGNIDASS